MDQKQLSSTTTKTGNAEPARTTQRGAATTPRPYVELELAAGYDCYDVKRLIRSKVVLAVERAFSDDDTLTLIPPPQKEKSIWKIQTDHIEKYEGVQELKDAENNVIANVTIRTSWPGRTFGSGGGSSESAPLQGGKEDEVLITLADANLDKFGFVFNDQITKKRLWRWTQERSNGKSNPSRWKKVPTFQVRTNTLYWKRLQTIKRSFPSSLFPILQGNSYECT